jgi:hypothetical protein
MLFDEGATDRGEYRQAAGAVASLKQQAHRVLRPMGLSLLTYGSELLLFCDIALHVKLITFSPRLTTHRAAIVPRLTTPRAGVVPRLTTLRATGMPRLTTLLPTGLLFLIVLHTGHWLSGRCWSEWCWSRSGWLYLSLSI